MTGGGYKFAVLTGTTSNTVGDAVLEDYPTGFTKDNTVVVGFMVESGTTSKIWRTFGIIAQTIVASVELAAKINITTRTDSAKNQNYKLLLYRTD